jgi:hypothetical protein
VTRKQIAATLRRAADRLEKGDDWSQADATELAQAVELATAAQMESESHRAQVITRAAFDGLTPNQRTAYLRDGGKIVDD